jgi:hypothetical protein
VTLIVADVGQGNSLATIVKWNWQVSPSWIAHPASTTTPCRIAPARHVTRTKIEAVPLRSNTAVRWRRRPRLNVLVTVRCACRCSVDMGCAPLATPTHRGGPRRLSTDRVNRPHRRMPTGRSGHTVVLEQHPRASAGLRYEEDLGPISIRVANVLEP